ncbi:MAG: VOC family protein [Pseudomonadota bacterium]
MIMHMTLGSNDLERAATFYDAVMPVLNHARAPIGLANFLAYASVSGESSGADTGQIEATGRIAPFLCVCQPYDGQPASRGNGFHIAWVAADKSAVDLFHATALAKGGSDEGAPGHRPRYSEDYYAAYVRDPDGNKLQAVFYERGRAAGPGGSILSHVTLPFDDLQAGLAFYEPVFATLGISRAPGNETPGEDYAFSRGGAELPVAYVQRPFDGEPAARGNGQHVSFFAETSAQVDRFFDTALALGAEDDGPPGNRPAYTQPYYAAYVRDPAGTKIQAVCKTGQ